MDTAQGPRTRSRAQSETSTSECSDAEPVPHPSSQSFACPVCRTHPHFASLTYFKGHLSRSHKWMLFTEVQLQLWDSAQCQSCAKVLATGTEGRPYSHKCSPGIMGHWTGCDEHGVY